MWLEDVTIVIELGMEWEATMKGDAREGIVVGGIRGELRGGEGLEWVCL